MPGLGRLPDVLVHELFKYCVNGELIFAVYRDFKGPRRTHSAGYPNGYSDDAINATLKPIIIAGCLTSLRLLQENCHYMLDDLEPIAYDRVSKYRPLGEAIEQVVKTGKYEILDRLEQSGGAWAACIETRDGTEPRLMRSAPMTHSAPGSSDSFTMFLNRAALRALCMSASIWSEHFRMFLKEAVRRALRMSASTEGLVCVTLWGHCMLARVAPLVMAIVASQGYYDEDEWRYNAWGARIGDPVVNEINRRRAVMIAVEHDRARAAGGTEKARYIGLRDIITFIDRRSKRDNKYCEKIRHRVQISQKTSDIGRTLIDFGRHIYRKPSMCQLS